MLKVNYISLSPEKLSPGAVICHLKTNERFKVASNDGFAIKLISLSNNGIALLLLSNMQPENWLLESDNMIAS